MQQKMSALDQIKALVFELRGTYKFDLTESTLLQKDVWIWGDDAPEFIELFAHMFNVDISEFNYAKYFVGEGSIYNPWITDLLKIEDDFGKKQLTLGDLVIAVEKGKLQ